MKIISWNVNGLNACIRKNCLENLRKRNADVCCFQEIKVSPNKMPSIFEKYESFWYPAEKKGYAGIVSFSRTKPLSVKKGIGVKEIDRESRIITLEFRKFFLINAYFPYAGRGLKRLDFKKRFNDSFLKFCEKLKRKKPVVIAGDWNVAHTELDLAKPRENEGNPGFTQEERKWFDGFLKKGYLDTFRMFTKGKGHYTWWTYRFNCRKRNIGWRVDYLVVSEKLRSKVKSSRILKDVPGSDHAPVELQLQNI